MGRIPDKITEIYVDILNWGKFNPRKDVRQNSWFRCEHSLFDNPEMINFEQSDIIVWLYLLCLASKKNNNEIVLYIAHAERIAKLSLGQVVNALYKLNDIKAIVFRYVTPTSRRRYADVTSTIADVTFTCSTNVRTNDTYPHVRARMRLTSLPPLVLIWNETVKHLPKVQAMDSKSKRYKASVARWLDNPDPEYWRNVISIMDQTPFLRGENDRGWVGNIEFLTRPDAATSILEGKYGKPKILNGHASSLPPADQMYQPDFLEFERQVKGETQ